MGRSAYGGDESVEYGLKPRTDARWLLFAGTILGLIGVVNVIQGISGIDGSKVYPAKTVFEFGSMKTWGWIVFVVGLVTIVASFAIFLGRSWARLFGIVVGGGNAIAQLLFVPAHPLWAMTMFAANLLVINALSAHWNPKLLKG
jgi:hypothetical protein